MLKTIAIIAVFGTSCGFFKSQPGPPPDVATDQSANLKNEPQKKNTWQSTALTADPEFETYSGRCITASNEGFLNNAGEVCMVVEQHYDENSDVCSEKIACELRTDEDEFEE